MIMSNFISETERHEELYSHYNPRHQEILAVIAAIKTKSPSCSELYNRLRQHGVSDSEIEWLKRTGHYMPSYN